MELICLKHKVVLNVLPKEERASRGKDVVCPVEGCTTGFDHIEGIGLMLGSRKFSEFGVEQVQSQTKEES